MQQHEMDDIGGAKELAKHRISVAYEDLNAAVRSIEAEDFRTANNRAYYAIFHAISACLALVFKSYKSHAQTLGAFNKEFVNKGVFPRELARKISRAQEVRHESDYSDFYIVSKDEAREQVETAKEVVQLVDEYLKAQEEVT